MTEYAFHFIAGRAGHTGNWFEANGLVKANSKAAARRKARVLAEKEAGKLRITQFAMHSIGADDPFFQEIKEDLLPEEVEDYQNEGIVIYDMGT